MNRSSQIHDDPSITRRDCLRYLICGWGLAFGMPLSLSTVAEATSGSSILDKYLEEQLHYQIGYWLIGDVGDAKTGFLSTNMSGIYRLRLEGHGKGFINFLLGGVKYTYTSFCLYLPDQDRLLPVYFELEKRRGGKKSLRTVRFDYASGEIVFEVKSTAGETSTQKEPMKTDRIYEDYLTLFYNFRHGVYGSLESDRKFLLPLTTQKKMQPVTLQIADLEKENTFRSREFSKTGKHFFVQFKINPEDVSSGSGEIKGWLSLDAVPVKGLIEDVVFFGDLWGELKERRVATNPRQVPVPDEVKNLVNGMLE